jgi:diguanylate cyclase (GGDEF)-like protein/PAS domain S-box-containing protein
LRNEIKMTEIRLFIENCKPLLAGVPLPCYLLDLEGNIVFSNKAVQELTGYKRHKEYQRNFISLLNEEGIGKALNHVSMVLNGERRSFQTTIKHRNGTPMVVNIVSIPVEFGGGVIGICGFIIDTSEKQDSAELTPAKWESIFTGIDICLGSLDALTLETLSISAVCESIFGYSEEEFLTSKRLWEKLIHPLDRQCVFAKFDLLKSGKSILQEYRIISKSGEQKWVSDFIVPIFFEDKKVPKRLDRIVVDISKRKKAEEKLTFLAFHDSLTGLPNRRKLDDELEKSLAEAKEKQQLVGILFLDLDRFKYINDSLGHKMGDMVLQIIAERLKDCVRNDDIISRQGGDEFVVLLKNVANKAAIEETASRIARVITEPIMLLENEYVLSASIGISVFPEHDYEADGLIQKADHAMYLAKGSGNAIQPYENGMTSCLSRKLLLEQYLHKAIEKEELSLEYQPIVDVFTKQVIGLEALLRWNHPVLGLISPGEFIEIAEESDLIIKLSDWVLKTACSHRRKWADLNFPDFYISINVPARQIHLESFVQTVKETLELYQLPAKFLKIEITERTAMTNVNKTLSKIKELQDFGVDIILDDFGIGYSSISYLVQYPFNTIKIDKSFILGLENKNKRAVCRTLVAMGRNLGMDVVAEGVEELEQYQYLCSIGCHNMQGYYFSKPCQPDRVERFFTNNQLHDWIK